MSLVTFATPKSQDVLYVSTEGDQKTEGSAGLRRFDPLADGARVSGPANRGLYRFRLKVRRSGVEIIEVEEEALGS